MVGSDVPLRVVMVYSDYPGERLVNNLNLILVGPDGRCHVGNGASDELMTMDFTNNVELAQIPVPQPGAWRIEVVASNVPQPKQPFALVVIGWLQEGNPEPGGWEELASTLGISIPDNDPRGITDSLVTTRSGDVKELEVSVDISHTWIGDLKVTLTGPSGTTAVLHQRGGGSRDNLIARYDTVGTPDLTAFIGKLGQGTWTLRVSDNAGRDIGKLNAWGLRLLR